MGASFHYGVDAFIPSYMMLAVGGGLLYISCQKLVPAFGDGHTSIFYALLALGWEGSALMPVIMRLTVQQSALSVDTLFFGYAVLVGVTALPIAVLLPRVALAPDVVPERYLNTATQAQPPLDQASNAGLDSINSVASLADLTAANPANAPVTAEPQPWAIGTCRSVPPLLAQSPADSRFSRGEYGSPDMGPSSMTPRMGSSAMQPMLSFVLPTAPRLLHVQPKGADQPAIAGDSTAGMT